MSTLLTNMRTAAAATMPGGRYTITDDDATVNGFDDGAFLLAWFGITELQYHFNDVDCPQSERRRVAFVCGPDQRQRELVTNEDLSLASPVRNNPMRESTVSECQITQVTSVPASKLQRIQKPYRLAPELPLKRAE